MFNTTSGRGDFREVDPPSSYEEHAVNNSALNITDQVANPAHYNNGTSPYDVAKSMYGAEGLLKFVTINSVKYISRYPHKYKGDPEKQLDDLIKAKRSLETAIELHKEIHGNQHIRHG